MKLRADPRLGRQVDHAAVFFHHIVGNKKAQAGAFEAF